MTLDHVPIALPHPNDIAVNKHALGIMQSFAFDATSLVLQFSLSSLLFGVLTILALSSVFLLLRRRALTNASIRIPLLTTVVLYASTSLYMAGLIWNWTSVTRIIREANEGLSSESYDGAANLISLENAVFKQSWMATAGLAANVIVGDAVVWWRACVIWRHRAVYYAGPIALLLTLAFGIVGALQSYPGPIQSIYFMVGGGGFADAAAALSLATNLAATALISIKAFLHNRRLTKYLGSSGGKTRALKMFALLIESGSVYCVILLVVLVYQFNSDTAGPIFTAEYFFVYGCLVPLVAIYPTGIVFLTALDWSPLHWGLSESMVSQGPLSTSEYDSETA
ncbi:hypothetical protein GSI_09592 [Ganoderma sinense ZZ0214-1]|uniref:Uncharacterized protein n=1 Tax=Ganoderma sinense ZZ0214-1 TaxID=1077348 RepID=A0A2G8S3E2_9APHY|nr:hypothetical protein GSI_09592 [Ganoderma sinense ZZ0214-1]